jgi:site-specific DNA-cytosine methylase
MFIYICINKNEVMKKTDEVVAVSLFDGMSCFQLALKKTGINVVKYYASEVDKYVKQVTMNNFPNTIQIGDVRNVKGNELGFVHVLAGGSPCQSFSFAGKRKGMSTKDEIEVLTLDHYLQLKNQNFEFEGQSYLFWEYMRVLNELREINPNIIFLLENVVMGDKWQKILTRAIGINPIKINSALVSAQNRNRLYWTNIASIPDGMFGDLICDIPQPKDKGILLKDILQTNVAEKYFLSDKTIQALVVYNERQSTNGTGFSAKFRNPDETIKMDCLKIGGGGTYDLVKIDRKLNVSKNQNKASCFTAGGNSGGNHSDMDLIQCVAMRGRNDENSKTEQKIEPRNDFKTNYLTSVQKDNLVMQINTSKESGGKQPYQQNRIYDVDGISPALCANKSDLMISGTLLNHNDGKGATIPARAREDGSGQNVVSIYGNIRRLTPTECERLQTVPDGYTDCVSDTQRYKMLGNGWTIDTIAHILSFIS